MRTWHSTEWRLNSAQSVDDSAEAGGDAVRPDQPRQPQPVLTDRDEQRRSERIKQRGFANARPSREAESRYTALLRPVESSDDVCLVTVIVDDVGVAVRAAGGWMCDRVRAGWRVSALVPAGHDVTPLQILGIRASFFDVESDRAWLTPKPATLAFSTDILSGGLPISSQVRACMRDSAIEVTVWGDGEIAGAKRFHDVHHQLSPAAQAFKKYAMRVASLPESTADTEALRSCAPWYPLDQVVDLNTVAAGGSVQS